MTITELIASYKRDIEIERRALRVILDRAKAEGRDMLTDTEKNACEIGTANLEDLRSKLERAEVIEREEADYEAHKHERYPTKAGLLRSDGTQVMHVGEEPHTYSRANDPEGQGRQFMLDVARGSLFGESAAQARLQRHQHEMRIDLGSRGGMEYRTDSYADSSDFPGLVIPQYLTDMFQPLAQNARPLADHMKPHQLPSEGLSVEVATGATGVSVVVNPGELGVPTPVGNFTVAPLTLAVNTVQTYATVSRQAIERGRTENVLMENMNGEMAAALDNMLLYQTTNGLHTVAVRNEFDDGSPTFAAMYPKIVAAISKAAGVAKNQAGELFVIAHPRRLFWAESEMSDTWPMVSQAGIPGLAGAAAGRMDYPGMSIQLPCGVMMYGDYNVATAGLDGDNPPDGGTEDIIYVVSRNQSVLLEEPNRVRYLRAEQPASPQLGVLFVMYEYAAFSHAMIANVHQKVDGTSTVAPSGF